MSGIYIPNMEMPKNCQSCPFACMAYQRVDGILAKLSMDDQIRSDCHLIPVPDHGRLIDADALEKDNWHFQRNVTTTTGCWIESMTLKDAPTIIPSDF